MLLPFFIWENNVMKKIKLEDIMSLRADDNYTTVFLSDHTKYIVRSSLTNTLKKLPGNIIIKIHRTYAVSVFHIDDIAKDHLILNKEAYPIGRQYYKSFMEKLNVIE